MKAADYSFFNSALVHSTAFYSWPLSSYMYFLTCQSQRRIYCVLSFSTKATCDPEPGLLYPLGNVVHCY